MRTHHSSLSQLLVLLVLFMHGASRLPAQSSVLLDDVLQGAQTAQGKGQYAQAAGLYAHATDLSPATAELWSNRGVMDYLAGQYSSCLQSMKRATQLNPALFTPVLFSAKSLVQLGKPSAAMPLLRRAHTLRPADPEVLLTMGKAAADIHQSVDAERFYLQAAASSPRNPDAWYGAGVAALQVIEENGSALARMQPRSLWSKALLADDLFAQDRPLEASAAYETTLATASPAQRTVLLRTLAWMSAHADTLSLPPRSAAALQALDGAHADASIATSGCNPAQKAASISTRVALVHTAACEFWDEHFEESAQAACKAVESQQLDAEAMYWCIKAQERIAVSALSRLEQISAQIPATYVLVGNLYRNQQQPDKALAEYAKALAINAHDPAALQGSVLAELDANRTEDALSLDRRALTDQLFDPQLNLLMAEILERQNKSAEEMPFLARAATVPAELQFRLHYLLGRVDERNQQLPAAIEQFELALPGDKDGSIHYQLSRLYRKQGSTEAADRMLAQAKVLIGKRDARADVAVREKIEPQ